MPIVNHATRVITCKLVYYGPGGSGKTSNLTHLYSALPAGEIGELRSYSTRRERTLTFEYTPTDLGSIGPYQMRFEICTTPGQSQLQAAREQMLKGADGIAFIADSRLSALDENITSLRDLHNILGAQGVSARSLPFVFQYNKQNFPPDDIATIGELSAALNFRHAPEFGADAKGGDGVVETLRSLGTQLLRRLGVGDVANEAAASTEIDFENLDFEMEKFQSPQSEAAA
ncbi:MAG: GTPase domain-containing protein [Gemmatimonadaceae bacterium]